MNLIEIYIPAIMLICLFVSFVVGIVFRYVFKEPQPWTYELSTVTFLNLAILSGCFVQRKNEHIVFDMVYEKQNKKIQCIMRIVGELIICFTATVLVPTAVKYVCSMSGLKTQILKWPRWCIFVCFPTTFAIMDIRALVRLILDVRGYLNGSYERQIKKERNTTE